MRCPRLIPGRGGARAHHRRRSLPPDSFVMSLTEEQYQAFGYPLPMTLGHEGVGVVDALGEGTTGVQVGESVAVYGPRGCGRCHACAEGQENYCPHAAGMGIVPRAWVWTAQWLST